MTNAARRRGRPPGKTGPDLIAAAREVFLESGYGAATMDAVAARAQISKASLYREHPSKDALFAAVVRAWAEAGRDAMRPHLERLAAGEDTRADLIDLAEVMRMGVLSRDVLGMRRLVTAEARRLPEVAASYLEESWDRNIRALAAALQDLGERGRLTIPDPLVAADQLTWLVIGSPLNRLLLTDADGVAAPAAPVADAVDLFLAGYGPSGR
ncbi:TetR/AcrR family transcriptional regulator [Glycomyces harbinensis]|uniref:Transcriptional regulator, TetR family n=1 Tax=Glycomyces harbinensis TaxID=58114 RepID=A0A1G7ALW0_9ACTN|nr:TetR/AcrR family transcriptional regulator [Glycomyces harbinensis]SDE15829.1 transcriptional regulator, TetR family [Glycomyces harbinensis]